MHKGGVNVAHIIRSITISLIIVFFFLFSVTLVITKDLLEEEDENWSLFASASSVMAVFIAYLVMVLIVVS